MKLSNVVAKTALLLAGCVMPESAECGAPQVASAPNRWQEIFERTERRFGKVVYYKPSSSDQKKTEVGFAPLIVEEISTGKTEDCSSNGTISKSGLANGRRLPQIYFRVIDADTSRSELQEIIYWWRHEILTETDLGTCQTALLGRGVRIVVGKDGMPVLWEAFGESQNPRLFFVADSVEAAAAVQFGEPLPGRRFSMERAIQEQPDIVVARVLDDGPVPMGPYVYADADLKNITTVLCRCMASQFDEAVTTLEFELVPLDKVDPGQLRAGGWPHPDRIPVLGPLHELFRWPEAERPEIPNGAP